jgi:acyl-CoA thioesterase
MQVTDSMINGLGVCHGGYIFTLADSAFAFACNGYDRVTFAASATIEFILPARVGALLVAEARECHRGKRSGIYDVTVHDEEGRLVALFRGRSRVTEAPVIRDDEGEQAVF